MTIEDYIHEFIAPDLPVLEAITAEQNARDDTRPNVGLDVGRLLGLLVRLTRCETCAGIWHLPGVFGSVAGGRLAGNRWAFDQH